MGGILDTAKDQENHETVCEALESKYEVARVMLSELEDTTMEDEEKEEVCGGTMRELRGAAEEWWWSRQTVALRLEAIRRG